MKVAVRSNLDPKSDHPDMELWDVLRRVGMARMPSESGAASDQSSRCIASLDTEVTAGAENFSQGERQLVCGFDNNTEGFEAEVAIQAVDRTSPA